MMCYLSIQLHGAQVHSTGETGVLLVLKVARDIALIPGTVECCQLQFLVWAAVRVMIKAFYAPIVS